MKDGKRGKKEKKTTVQDPDDFQRRIRFRAATLSCFSFLQLILADNKRRTVTRPNRIRSWIKMSAHRRGTLRCLLLQTKRIPGGKKNDTKKKMKYAYNEDRERFIYCRSLHLIKSRRYFGFSLIRSNHHVALFCSNSTDFKVSLA